MLLIMFGHMTGFLTIKKACVEGKKRGKAALFLEYWQVRQIANWHGLKLVKNAQSLFLNSCAFVRI